MNTKADDAIDFAALTEKFHPDELEWRVLEAGKGKDGKIWAKVVCYVNNRAIMDRLDDVCGPGNWQNDYKPGPAGGVICGLSIRVDGAFVTKWDGAENTDIEGVKGGLSTAMKRAAVQWGLARYLYDIENLWANIHPDGSHYSRLPKDKGGDAFKWDPPTLSHEFVPGHYDADDPKTKRTPAPKANGNGKPREQPGSEADSTAPAMAAIRNAHTGADIAKYRKVIGERAGNLEYTAEQTKKLEAALNKREAELAQPAGT